MAIQKIYKVVQKIANGSATRHFTQEALANVSAELFFIQQGQTKDLQISVIEIDTAAVNLDAFLKAGGMLVGPIELK